MREGAGLHCDAPSSALGGGAAEQLLDQRDAFGLHAAQNGRALADDQALLPKPCIGRLRADRPGNGLNPWRSVFAARACLPLCAVLCFFARSSDWL